MDAVIARIKELVLKFYPNIKTDLNITDEQLELYVEDATDSALAVMNREQLVQQYEDDLISYPPVDDENDDFWKRYDYPIPAAVEKAIARAVIGSARSVLNGNTAQTGAVKSASDNGQSVSFGDQLQNFFSSSNDAEIFGGSIGILKRYLIADVYCNDSTD